MGSQIIAWPPEAMAVIDDLSHKCLFQRKLIIQMHDTHIAEREAFVERFRQYREQTEEHIKKLQMSYAEALIDLISNREDVLAQLDLTAPTQRPGGSEGQQSFPLQDSTAYDPQTRSYRQILDSMKRRDTIDGDGSPDYTTCGVSLRRSDVPLSAIQEQFITALLQQEFNDQVRCITEEYRLLLREAQEKYTEAKLSFEQITLALKAKTHENHMLRTKLKKYIMMDGGFRAVSNEVVNFNSIVSNALSNTITRQQEKDLARSFSTKKPSSPAVMGRPATVGSFRFSDADVNLSRSQRLGKLQQENEPVASPSNPKPKHSFRQSRHRELMKLKSPQQMQLSAHNAVPYNSLVNDVHGSFLLQSGDHVLNQSNVDLQMLSSHSNNDLSHSNVTIVRYPSTGGNSSTLLDDLHDSTGLSKDSCIRYVTIAVGDENPHNAVSITISHDVEIKGEKIATFMQGDPLLTCPNPHLKSSTDSILSVSNPPEHNHVPFQSIKESTRSLLLKQTPVLAAVPAPDRERSTAGSVLRDDDNMTTFHAAHANFMDTKAQRLRTYHLMRTAVGKQGNEDEAQNTLSTEALKTLKKLSTPPSFKLTGYRSSSQGSSKETIETGLLLQVQKCTLTVENEVGEHETQTFYDKKIHTSILPFIMSTNITHRQLIERLSILERKRKERDTELVNSHTLMNAALTERKEAVLAKERIERQLLAIVKERDVLMQSYDNRLNSLQFNLKDTTERASALHKECSDLNITLQISNERYSLLEAKYQSLSAKVREDVIAEMRQIENATIGHLQADIVFYKDSLLLSEERIVELARENCRLEQANSELKVDVLKQTLHRDKLKQQLRDEIVIEYSRQIHALEEQIKIYSEKIAEKTKETGDLTDAIYRLRSDVDFLTEENANMHINMHSLSTEMADIVQKYHTIESDRRVIYSRHEKLQQELAALQMEKSNLEAALSTHAAEQEEKTFKLNQIIDAYRIKYLLAMRRGAAAGKDKETLCLLVENIQTQANSVVQENAKELEELNAYASRLKESQKESKMQNTCTFDSFSFTLSRDNSSATSLVSNKNIKHDMKKTALGANVFRHDSLCDSNAGALPPSPDESPISDVIAFNEKDLSIDEMQPESTVHNALLQYRQSRGVGKSTGIVVSNQTVGLAYSETKTGEIGDIKRILPIGVGIQTDTAPKEKLRDAVCQAEPLTESIGLQALATLDLLSADSELLAEAYDQVEKLRAEKRLALNSHSAVLKTARVRMQNLETELLSQARSKESLAATIIDLTQKLANVTDELDNYKQQYEQASGSLASLMAQQNKVQVSALRAIETQMQGFVNTMEEQYAKLYEKAMTLAEHLSQLEPKMASLKPETFVIRIPQLENSPIDQASDKAIASSSAQDTASMSSPVHFTSSSESVAMTDKSVNARDLLFGPCVVRGIQVNAYYSMLANESGRQKLIECDISTSSSFSISNLLPIEPNGNYNMFGSSVDLDDLKPSQIRASATNPDVVDTVAGQASETPPIGTTLITNTMLLTVIDVNEEGSVRTSLADHRGLPEAMSAQETRLIHIADKIKVIKRSDGPSYVVTYQDSEEDSRFGDHECYIINPCQPSEAVHSRQSVSSNRQKREVRNTTPEQEQEQDELEEQSQSNAPSSSLPATSLVLHCSYRSVETPVTLSLSNETVPSASDDQDKISTELTFAPTELGCPINTQSNHYQVDSSGMIPSRPIYEFVVPEAFCKGVVTIDIELNMMRLACAKCLIVPSGSASACSSDHAALPADPADKLESLNLFTQEAVCKYCGAYTDLSRYISENIADQAQRIQRQQDSADKEQNTVSEKPSYMESKNMLETFVPEQKVGWKLKHVSFGPPVLLDKYAHYPLMVSSLLLKQSLQRTEQGVAAKHAFIGSPLMTARKIEYVPLLEAYAFAHDAERERDKMVFEDCLSRLYMRQTIRQKVLQEYTSNTSLQSLSAPELVYKQEGKPTAAGSLGPSVSHTTVLFDVIQDQMTELRKMNATLLFDNRALQVKLCENEKMLSIIFGRSYNSNLTSADILLGRPADTSAYTKEDFERYRLVLKETMRRYKRPKTTSGESSDAKLVIVRPFSAQTNVHRQRIGSSASYYQYCMSDSAIRTVDDLVQMSRPAPTSSPIRDAMSFSHRISPFLKTSPFATSPELLGPNNNSPEKDLPQANGPNSEKLTIVSTLPSIPGSTISIDPPPIYDDGVISRVSHAFIRRQTPVRGCSTSLRTIPPVKPPSVVGTPKRSRAKPTTSISVFYRGISPKSEGRDKGLQEARIVSVDN